MRQISLLVRTGLLLGALAGNVAHAGNIIVGGHVNNIGSMTEPQHPRQRHELAAKKKRLVVVEPAIGGAGVEFGPAAHQAAAISSNV